jgi:hypothetical protein
MDLKDRLAQFDQEWEQAEVETDKEYDALPDGKYQVVVDEVEIVESKAGNLQLKWQFGVFNGSHKGRKIWKYNGLEKTEHIEWLKKDIYTAGVEVRKLSDLPGQLNQLLDRVLEVTLKTKGDFTNVYINKLVDAAGDDIPGDDDFPF